MGNFHCLYLVLLPLCFGFFVNTLSRGDSGSDAITDVYIVTLKQAPAAHHFEEQLRRQGHHQFHNGSSSGRLNRFHKPRNNSRSHPGFRSYISRVHDSLLRRALRGEKYLKLYSYHYLVNGFAVFITPEQANKLSRRREVANVVLDFAVRTATTHTPQFLGLPKGAWSQGGGFETAGEGIVIGFIDTGIDPTHPSFAADASEHSYPVPAHFSGVCEVTPEFPSGSCNRKLVGARHFAASAITRGIFNSSQDYASPFDGDGHGTHTASAAAGNHGIPVVVAGHHFGNASGMAPRSHIAVYKALYKSFGGFAADVVAGIDQAAQDGVDIISLSITPNRRPPGIATFFNPIDMALLSAVKAGIFVVQAAGNTGPSPKSMSSFSPWIFTVGAASHDRAYSNSIILGNNVTIPGVGLAPGTNTDKMYTLISAVHALCNDTILANDMYVGECQDSSNFNEELIQGNLLICSYSIRFVLGLSTIKQALETAKNLSAAGVVFYMDPFVIGFQLNPTPLERPGIIIPSPEDSKILLRYYNSSLERNGLTRKIARFGAVATISGGLKANYSITAPKVMYYSARGPDPEDSFLDDADIMKPNLVAPGNMIWAEPCDGSSTVSDLMAARTESGATGLYIAAENNSQEIFSYLLKFCDVEIVKIRSKSDFNTFHVAAKLGHLGIVKELLGIWPELCEICDSTNTSPLYSAAVKGHLDVANAILSADASCIRIVRKNGKTALHTAARYGLIDVVKALIDCDQGIVSIKDKKGQTALHMAVKGQCPVVVDDILLADHSILNERDKKGNTALHIATRKSRLQNVSLLLTYRSIDVNAVNNQQETAMDLADKLQYGESALEINEALTEAGAKHARYIGQVDEAMELKRTVSDIKHEVHSQFIQNEKTNRRVTGIAKELRKLHREAVQNTTNSITVVAVLFASIAFLAIFNLPGQYIQDGPDTGRANIAHHVGFQVFCLLNAISLFISLAVVVVQITLVAWDTTAQKQVVSVVNKLMWAACACTCGAFLSIAFVVVGKRSSWMAVTITIIGAPILVGTLASMCYFVFKQRFGFFRSDSQRRIKRASGSKSFSWSYSANISDVDEYNSDLEKIYAL